MLTPHCSAASGMVAPPSIVSITRLRKSSEYGFAIHAGLLPVGSLNHIRAGMGIPDSAFSGNALVSQGKLDEALEAYRDSLAIRERLVASDRSNTQWQRDLSLSRNKIGDVLL